jgi:hypothetical protein
MAFPQDKIIPITAKPVDISTIESSSIQKPVNDQRSISIKAIPVNPSILSGIDEADLEKPVTIDTINDDTDKLNDLDKQLSKTLKEKEKAYQDYLDNQDILGDPSDMPGTPLQAALWPSMKQEYDQKIDSLKTLRNSIKSGLSSLSDPNIIDAVYRSSKFLRDSNGKITNNFLQIKNQLGEPAYNRIERLTYDNSFDMFNENIQKSADKKGDGLMAYNYGALKARKLNVTKEEEIELKNILKESLNENNLTDPIDYDKKRSIVDSKVKEYVDNKFPDKNERQQKYMDYSRAMNALMFMNPDNGKLSMYGLKTFVEDNLKRVNSRFNELASIKKQVGDAENTSWPDGSDPISKLVGDGEESRTNYESLQEYKNRINTAHTKLSSLRDLENLIMTTPEHDTDIRNMALGNGKEVNPDDVINNSVKTIEENWPIRDIISKINDKEINYQPTWEEKQVLELYNGLKHYDFGEANNTIQDLKSINWEATGYAKRFGRGIKSLGIGVKSGTEELVSKALPALSLPANPAHGLFNPTDMYLASEKMKDVALQDFKDRQQIYGKGTLYTMGTFAPLLAGTIASIATAPFSGGSSLALIPEIIGQATLTGMISDVVGNSLIEQEQYNKEKGIEDDDVKKWGIALAQGASMMVAGKIIGSSSKLLTSTVGKAVGLSFRESPLLAEQLMQSYIKQNPVSWQKLGKQLVTNTIKEVPKQTATMALMTATNDYLANLALNEGDKKKFEQIVMDSWQSAKAGALFGFMIGPMATTQSAIYNHLRRKTNGLNIIQTKDGNIYERVGSDPDNVNQVIVLDKDLNATKIKIEDIVDGFSMTTKEKNQYLEAYRKNQKAMPEIEKSIRQNAIKRQITSIADKVAFGDKISILNAQDNDGNSKMYFVKNINKQTGEVIMMTVEPRGDGTYDIRTTQPTKVDLSKVTEVSKNDFIINGINFYSKEKTETGKPKETESTEEPIPGQESLPETIKPNDEEIRNKYKDLDELGLLEEKDGKVVEPNYENLYDLRNDLNNELEGLKKEIRNPEYNKLPSEKQQEIEDSYAAIVDQITAVENHLDRIAKEIGSPFENELPSVKHEILAEELSSGKKLSGEAVMMDYKKMYVQTEDGKTINKNISMLVTTEDGRSVKAYINRTPETTDSDIEKIRKLIKEKKKVTLELIRKEDWNPDDHAVKTVVNERTGESETFPYGDKIDVKIGDKVIGSVQQNDWEAKKIRDKKYKEVYERIKNTVADILYKAAKKAGGIAELMNADELSLKKLFQNLVNDIATIVKMKAEDAIKYLRSKIKELGLKPEEEKFINELIKRHEDDVVEWVESKLLEQRLGEQFKVKKVKPFEIEKDFDEEEFEGVSMSAPQKVDASMKRFFPLWKDISRITGQAPDQINHHFINILSDKNNGFETVVDENTYQHWLTGLRDGNEVTEKIVDTLSAIPFRGSVSMFNFYNSMDIVEHIGEIINESGQYVPTLLNPSDDYDQYVKNVEKHLIELKPDKVKSLATNFKREIEERFRYYRGMSPEEKITAKEEQWKRDLQFLKALTNLDWKPYYVEKTKETYSFPNPLPKSAKDKINYGTYSNLIQNETYRVGKDNNGNPWVWHQGDIVWQLLYNKEYRPEGFTTSEFFKIVNKYFLQGDPLNNVSSNVYKLVTAQSGSNDLGMHGYNVKGDRITSILQSSDLSNTAKNILTSTVNNPIVSYYKSIGEPMKIVIIDGLHNRSIGKSREGNTSGEMSVEDLWVTELLEFGKQDDTYKHIIGQFSDKTTLYSTKVPAYKDITLDDMFVAKQLLDKEEPTMSDLSGDEVYQRAFEHIKYEIIALHSTLFKPFAKGEHTTKYNEFDDFINNFIVNYVFNSRDLQQIFFGEINAQSYPGGFVMVTKRAGSFSSAGRQLNPNIIGGVGHELNFVLANEQAFPHLGIKENQNGAIVMSGSFAGKVQISDGDIYSKPTKFPKLHSLKAVMAFKHSESNMPELTKANILNIDILDELLGDIMPTVREMKKFMDKHKIDILSLPSSSKIHYGSEKVDLFDENGKVRSNVQFDPKRHIEKRSTSTIIIQQDLRHQTKPKKAKEPSQFLTNMFATKSAPHIISLFNEIQRRGLEALHKALVGNPQYKLDYVLDNANENTQSDLIDMIKAGITMDDPAYRSLMHVIQSSAIGRTALNVPINRVNNQEIPDFDGVLKGFTPSEDGKHLSLPDTVAAFEGARESEIFEGTLEEAKDYIISNIDKYQDYIDDYAQVKDWELLPAGKGKWEIRGEPVPHARVPFTGLNSFTFARLKKNLAPYNFAARDKASVENANLDYDGDAAFSQSFFKSNGKVFFNPSSEGYMNEILMNVMRDYEDPEMLPRLTRSMDVHAYDDIVRKLYDPNRPGRNRLDPISMMQIHEDYGVGFKLKGAFTNHLTVFALLNRYNIPVRRMSVKFADDGKIKELKTEKIVFDKHGGIQAHLMNLVQMAFDNAKDPKLEMMGINEHTNNIAMFMFFTNPRLNSDLFDSFDKHYAEALDVIEDIVGYLHSPLMKEFVRLQRRRPGAMRNETDADIWKYLKDNGSFTESAIEQLKSLYYAGRELAEFRTLYGITQVPPKTYVEYIDAKAIIRKVKFLLSEEEAKRNNVEFRGMKYFKTRNLFIEDKNDPRRIVFVPELKIAEDVIKFCQDNLYNDIIEESIPGKQIIKHLFGIIKADKKGLTDMNSRDLAIVSNSLNKVFNIKSVGINKRYSAVNKELRLIIPTLADKYPDNTFLQRVGFIDEKTKDGKIVTNIAVKEARESKIQGDILKAIRKDFDRLPEEAKDLFAMYTIYRYGANNATSNGGFYKLLGIDYRVDLSQRMTAEKMRWINDELSPVEKMDIANWMKRTINIESIKKSVGELPRISIIDYYADPEMQNPISRDALDSLEQIQTDGDIKPLDQFNLIKESYGLNDIVDWSRQILGIAAEGKKTVESLIIPAVKKYKADRIKRANIHFGNNSKDKVVRDFTPGDKMMNLMLNEDPVLQKQIQEYFKKAYPGLIVFENEDSFIQYVNRNSDELIPVNLGKIGHAFGNAMYVDPDSPIQEVTFHEMGHIYWDHLPPDHPSKVRLREVFSEDKQFKDLDGDDLDEVILNEIGNAGTNKAPLYIKSSLYQKFLNALKDFWRSVKEFFGKFSKQDLINDLIHDIYTNKDNIDLSTPEGVAAVRDMVEFDKSSINAYYDKPNHICKIAGKNLSGVTSSIKSLQFIKFNPLEKIGQMQSKWRKEYYKKNGVEPPEEMDAQFAEELKIRFDESGNAGSYMHSIAEYVFKGTPLTKDALDGFSSQKVLDEFKRSLERFKAEILQKYPNAQFKTEHEIISPKYKMFGIADLIIDIGDNKLILCDYKTTEFEYKDAEGERTEDYVRNYGMMKAPFDKILQSHLTDHTIQLSIEALMLEEQRDELNPSAKNQIEGLYIIPIVRQLSNDGKINKARISNIVSVPGTDISYTMPFVDDKYYNAVHLTYKKNIAKTLMGIVSQRATNIETLFPQFETDLKDQKINPIIRNELKKAVLYMTTAANIQVPVNPKSIGTILQHVTWKSFMDIHENSNRKIYKKLLELSYDKNDINTLSPEEYINITHGNIKKRDYPEIKKTHFVPQKVGERFRRIPNENIPPEMKNQHYYHIKINGKDIYSHDGGTADVKPGMEIVDIREEQLPLTKSYDYEFYTVSKVDAKYKTVWATNNKTGDEKAFRRIEKNLGLHIHDPKGHIPERKTTPNNFIQRLIPVFEPIEETHWKHNIPMTSELIASQEHLWEFYAKYQTKEDISKLTEDFDLMMHYVSDVFSYDQLTEPLMDFLRETLLNHMEARAIIEEAKFGKLYPTLLNLYWQITNPNKSFIDLHGWYKNAYWWQPPALISNEFVGINTHMLHVQQLMAKKTELVYDLRRTANKLIENNSEPIDIASVKSTVRKNEYWVRPDHPKLNNTERKWLELVYKTYYTHVPEYLFAEGYERGSDKYPQRIKIDQQFRTPQEFREDPVFGKAWGDIAYELLKPSAYDDTYVNLVIKREGRFVETDDKMKWKDIKKQFADKVLKDNALTPDTIDEWLWKEKEGKKGIKRLPLIRSIEVPGKHTPLVPGKLHYYYMQAMKNYSLKEYSGKKGYSRQRRITSINTQHKLFATKHLLESTELAMEKHIEANIMKHSIPVVDQVIKQYTDRESQLSVDYLTDYTNSVVFHQYKQLRGEFSQFVNHIVERESLATIAYSVAAGKTNLLIGQAMNVTYDAPRWKRGIERFSKNPQKCLNILKLQNLVNLIDDAKFDELMDATGSTFRMGTKDGKGISRKDAERFGYFITDWVEKLNQYFAWIGGLSDTQFNAYNDDGNVRDESKYEHVSNQGKVFLTDRVQRLQGHYGVNNAAPAMLGSIGKAVYQFKKFWPALISLAYSPIHFDRFINVDGGMIQALAVRAMTVNYNLKSGNERFHEFERVITEKRLNKYKAADLNVNSDWVNAMKNMTQRELDQQLYVIKGLNDYFDSIIADRNGGKIKFKEDIDDNIKRQFYASMISMGFLALSLAIIMSKIAQGKLQKKWYAAEGENLAAFLNKFDQDFFAYAHPKALSQLWKKSVPAIDYLVNSGKFVAHSIQYMISIGTTFKNNLDKHSMEYAMDNLLNTESGRYTTDPSVTPGQYVPKGTPKFVRDALGVVPAGGLIKTVFSTISWAGDKRHALSVFRKNDMNEELVQAFMDAGMTEETTIGHFKEWIQKGKVEKEAFIKAQIQKAYEEKGIGPQISDIESYIDDLKNDMKYVGDYEFHQKVLNSEIEGFTDIDEVTELADKYDKEQAKKLGITKRKLKRNYEYSQKELEYVRLHTGKQ